VGQVKTKVGASWVGVRMRGYARWVGRPSGTSIGANASWKKYGETFCKTEKQLDAAPSALCCAINYARAKFGQGGTKWGPAWAKLGPKWTRLGPSWRKFGPSQNARLCVQKLKDF
jgi:hypothetical protein